MRERCHCGKRKSSLEPSCPGCTRETLKETNLHPSPNTNNKNVSFLSNCFNFSSGLPIFYLAQLLIIVSPFLYTLTNFSLSWVTFVSALAILGVSIFAQRNAFIKIGLLHDHELIYSGERHRLASSAFVHAGAFHLLFNLLALISFGRALEGYFIWRFDGIGAFYYSALIIIGAFLTGALQYIGERYLGYTPSLGASALVLLIVSTTIVLDPNQIILLLFIPLPGWLFLSLFTSLTVFSMLKGSKKIDAVMTFGTGRINHLGHLTGLLSGIALGLLLLP